MITQDHILSREGILISFSIAKKISDSDIKRLKRKMCKSSVNDNIDEKLKVLILQEAVESAKKNLIPGLIPVPDITDEEKKIMELTFLAEQIFKKISGKTDDTYHSCFVINALVNLIGLTEDDFDEFHRKFSKDIEDNEDNGTDEELGMF